MPDHSCFTTVVRAASYFQGACLLLLFTVVCGCDTGKEEPEYSLPTNDSLRFSSHPLGEKPLLPLTSKPLGEFEQACKLFQSKLRELESFADQVRINDKAQKVPAIFAAQFETSFLDRKKLRGVFDGERIRIARWRLDDKTPTFYETIAVNRLFKTMLDPWKDSSQFRIEFKLHTVVDRPNYFDAEVRADIFGTVESPTARVNGAQSEVGRTATGLWQIIWQKGEPGSDPRIKKINVLAHEETINYIGGGTLFRDCTQSVLRNAPDVQKKLSFGLDAWAKQIPGLDITGNCGLAIGDVNNDGLDDVYVCQPHGMANMLLIQNPDGTADDAAKVAGVDIFDHSSSALLVDIDNDRRQDLVVATDSKLVLYSNSGDGKFQLEYKLDIGHSTDSLSAIDFDQDGDLDFYLSKFRPVSRFDDVFAQPKTKMSAINGGRNILLRNDEAWQFNEATSDVGISFNNQQYTRAAIWNDFDSDGDYDLYHANEFGQDVLFENQNAWFVELDKAEMLSTASNNTTVSAGDFNHDGRSDFFIGSNASFASLRITQDYINAGGKQLKEAEGFGPSNKIIFKKDGSSFDSFELNAPILSSESTYGSVVADFNNDSWEDIAVTNGMLSRSKREKATEFYYRNLFDPKTDLDSGNSSFIVQHEVSDLFRKGDSFDGHQRNACFLSLGAMRFANYSNGSGFDYLDDARAVAATDWDGDGDVDLIVANRTAPRFRVLRNVYSSKNQFLKFRLVGTSSNRDAIGSRVEVFLRGSDVPLVKTLMAGSGRSAQSSKEMHFGLGKATAINRVVVYWPNGGSQSFDEVTPNKTYRLIEGKDELEESADDRYRIALDSKPIEVSTGMPERDHVRFFPTTRLPILQYRVAGNDRARWYQIENIEQRPLLCVFCPNRADNAELLRDWGSKEQDIAKMNADMLVVFTGNVDDSDIYVKESADQIEDSGVNFRWGVLSQNGNQKLSQIMGQWLFAQEIPDKPFAVILDGEGNIHFGYHEDQLTWENIAGDFQNIAERNFSLNRIPDRVNENWIQTYRTPRFDRLQMRFQEAGYVRDSKDYKELLGMQHSEDYLNRAIDLASKDKLPSALTAAERSVELDSNSVQSLIGVSQVLQKYALTADQQARKRMLRSAGEYLDQALEKEPNNVDAVLARAEVFRLQRDVENALQLLKKYLKNEPESWQVHAIAGRLFFHKQEYFEATKHLITAIENRPTLPYVAADLGYLYLINSQFEDAKSFLKLAIRLQPSDQKLKQHLAEAEYWLGNFESSGELFEAIAVTQPTMSHQKQMLAWLKASSPLGSFRDGAAGLGIIEPFVELKSNSSPSSLEIMAACLAELGKYDEALDVQRQALQLVENNETLERYADRQKQSLKDRLELYKRQRPYRIKSPDEAPLQLLGGN